MFRESPCSVSCDFFRMTNTNSTKIVNCDYHHYSTRELKNRLLLPYLHAVDLAREIKISPTGP